ncbi:TrbI/VirB10 family protein [Moritella viscosa]|uniref:TrbI/VirB10 family protein n=1 Tax=Moritella viscosa TaxID=80854 RepID=UPI00091D4A6B|nr:TrbI/VirB10 family protein [Moritella viscosa]SGZ09596.1 Conjugative transfer protein TraB [Moritella viscosa]
MLGNLLKKVMSDPTGDFDSGSDINKKNKKRNNTVSIVIVTVLMLAGFAGYELTRPPIYTAPINANVDFTEIIEDDFTTKDNQSALSVQQAELLAQQAKIDQLTNAMSGLKSQTDNSVKAQQESFQAFEKKISQYFEASKRDAQDSINALAENLALKNNQGSDGKGGSTENSESGAILNSHGEFGAMPRPPRPSASTDTEFSDDDFSYQPSQKQSFSGGGIDNFDFAWEQDEEDKKRRTIKNYVPTGTFVTAVVTGGADTNAGVLGQGDTVPMVFQTLNEGILPNGEKSRLKNCTITASAYGEISSSRGIVRTNRMSCIFKDGEIIDLPVKGTVFNFGRNGIRGTTILKNGKIVQMAGISGILTGIGETGKALSATTSTSALGSSSSIDSGSAGLNLLGNATSSIGSKLADYYIKLAELYHPIVELNPGNVVNIVFLAGFPLDALSIEEYEEEIAQENEQKSSSNQVLDVITNNPLMNSLPPELHAQKNQQFGQQTSPFVN